MYLCVCVCVCACVRAWVGVCVRAFAHMYWRARVWWVYFHCITPITLLKSDVHTTSNSNLSTHTSVTFSSYTHTNTYTHTHTHKYPCSNHQLTGWQNPMGCLIFIGHFPQKSPIIGGSFAKRDLQLKASCASSRPCTKI